MCTSDHMGEGRNSTTGDYSLSVRETKENMVFAESDTNALNVFIIYA